MHKLFKSHLLFLLLLSFLYGGLSGCKPAVKKMTKSKKSFTKKRTSKKSSLNKKKNTLAIRSITAAGAFIVTSFALSQAFAEADPTDPIETTIINQTSSEMNINVTIDGNSWVPNTIAPYEEETFTSGNQGLIGLDYLGQLIKVDESNDFIVRNVNNSVSFYNH